MVNTEIWQESNYLAEALTVEQPTKPQENVKISKRVQDPRDLMDKLLGRYNLRVYFIRKNGEIFVKRRIVRDSRITFKQNMYNVYSNSVYFIKNKPTIFYYEDNPDPIIFDSENIVPIVNSKALYKAWNSKIVNDILSYGQLSTTQKVTFGLLIGGAIAFVIMYSVIRDGGVNATNSLLLLPFWKWKKN